MTYHLSPILRFLCFCMVMMIMLSCEEESDPRLDEETFVKIYDNNQFNAEFNPIDLKQTADGGYLILATRRLLDTEFLGTYLLKVDNKGAVVREVEVDGEYVHPIPDLMPVADKFYFFCMNRSTAVQLVEIDETLESVNFIPVGLVYPAAASLDNNQFVLLSYNDGDRASVVSTVDISGSSSSSPGYTIGVGENLEETVINHFTGAGRQYPFQVGKIQGGPYFFNGFFDYTFSLVFLSDLGQDEPNGVVYGQQNDGGFSALMPIASTKFAAARFDFGHNFLLPNENFNISGITNTVDYDGYTLPELVPNARVKIIRSVIKTKNTLIYACDTKARQIALLFYDESTGAFVGSKYLGFSNPFEVGALIQTDDEGLAVCGTTQVAGRFPRISLFKLSKEELEESIQVE